MRECKASGVHPGKKPTQGKVPFIVCNAYILSFAYLFSLLLCGDHRALQYSSSISQAFILAFEGGKQMEETEEKCNGETVMEIVE